MARDISVEAVKAMRDTGELVCILDVREPWELEVAGLDDVLAIPMAEVPAQVDAVPRDRPVMVLCRSGVRSARVADWLETQGFDNAMNVEGGILAWAQRLDPSLRQY